MIRKVSKKLYFTNNKEYVQVIVWPNVDELRKHEKKEPDVAGVFIPGLYSIFVHEGVPDRRKIPKKIGEIHLARNRVGVGYVAHEIAHACLHYAETYGKNIVVNHDHEEDFCYEITKLTKDFWNWWLDKEYEKENDK